MALKGNLSDFGIVQLLNLVNLAKKTGTLAVGEDDTRATLSFEEGKLVYATMQGGDADSQLAAALRRSGVITEGQARTIESRAGSRSDQELGVALVNAGYVTQSEVIESIRAHVLRNVHPLFAWREGWFEFESGRRTNEGVIAVSIDVEDVIMGGTGWLEQWQRLEEQIPDLEASLDFADGAGAHLGELHLSADEWQVISFVNPRNTISQISERNSLSVFEIREIVARLLDLGVVKIAQAEESAGVMEPRPQKRPATVAPNVVQRLIGRIRGQKGRKTPDRS